jgi:hypothetical protein
MRSIGIVMRDGCGYKLIDNVLRSRKERQRKSCIQLPDMLQEDISMASAWYWNVRPWFSPDEAYQGHAASERKNFLRRKYSEVH